MGALVTPAAAPAHGTVQRWRHGCTCYPCWEAHREYMNAFNRHGRPYTCDAGEAREYLHALAAAGVGQRAVCRLTGLAYSTVRDVKAGRQRRIRKTTAEAILGVPLGSRVHGHRVDLAPALELVERLAAAGVERQEIATRLGYASPSLHFTTNRRGSIQWRTWRRLVLVARILVREGRAPYDVLEGLT